MSRRMQVPLNQLRHSNVAVVSMKKGSKKVEIACYKNKVVAYRNGLLKEKDEGIDDVLQIERVFADVGKGEFASKDLMKTVLGDEYTNEKKALQYILDHGQLQVSQAERTGESDQMLKEICTVISEKCVNSETGRPYPVAYIVSTLKDLQFQIKLDHSAKKQALNGISRLLESQTIPIRRAPMLIRCSATRLAGSSNKKARAPDEDSDEEPEEESREPSQKASPVPEKETTEEPGTTADGACSLSALEGAKQWCLKQAGIALHSDPTLEQPGSFLCMIDPGLFRAVDTYLRDVGGAVQVLQAAVMVTSVGDADDFKVGAGGSDALLNLPSAPIAKKEKEEKPKGRKSKKDLDEEEKAQVAQKKDEKKAKRKEKKAAVVAAQQKKKTPTPENSSDDEVVGSKKAKKRKTKVEETWEEEDEAWMNGEGSDYEEGEENQ